MAIYSGEQSGLNNKIVALTILVFISFAAVTAPLGVLAQNTNIGVQIYQISPSSASASVGTLVNVLGSIHTPNSTYQLVLGRTVVASGTAQGYYVDANFTVPESLSGPYALVLRDTAININSSQQFTITTGYAVNSVPDSIQEGNSLKLNVSVTGAQAGASYTADVTVELPGSAGKYTKTVVLGTANQRGTANAQVNFPDATFSPEGANTNFAGKYKVYFNQSASLAQSEFSVNFLDSNTYNRGQTVNIRATGYQPNQAATITITSVKTSTPLDTLQVTASTDGTISTTWVVSADAAIGDYTVKITPDGTAKLIQDQQTFTIAGYAVKVQTTNLAGETVPDLTVQAVDSSNNVYNATSGSDGIANLRLEKGLHALSAFLNGVKVGETNVTVTGEATFTIRCLLTNLKVTVKNANGIVMPFVDLNIAYRYGGSRTGSASGQTGPMGSYTLPSTPTDATYTFEASMYNQVFNTRNNTVNSLPEQATSEIVIISPSENITINVVGYNQHPIAGARVELVELSNGLFHSATTDSNGAVNSLVTFGKYRARVFKDNILLSETNLEAFNQSQKLITCTLYGIAVSVSVVDLFGSPISNANVTLIRPETEKLSAMTQSDGKAIFEDIIGGDMQILAYASNAPNDYQAVTLNVDQPRTVEVKLNKFVAVGPLLIQASLLLTIAIILVAVVLFALVEIYRRRRTKPVNAS